MSVSDPYGRVVAERASAGETGALLLVQTPMGNAQATLYARWGDVLGWLAEGQTPDQIVASYPELSPDDIRACLAHAAARESHEVRLATAA